MPQNVESQKQTLRKQAAQLLEAVIDERVSPQFAINRWPETVECPDPSLESAFQALWHFEADEDKQKHELFYLDAQLELLRQMAGFLKHGHALPGYFLRSYLPAHRVRFFYLNSPWQGSIQWLGQHWKQWTRGWTEIWRQALQISPIRSQHQK